MQCSVAVPAQLECPFPLPRTGQNEHTSDERLSWIDRYIYVHIARRIDIERRIGCIYIDRARHLLALSHSLSGGGGSRSMSRGRSRRSRRSRRRRRSSSSSSRSHGCSSGSVVLLHLLLEPLCRSSDLLGQGVNAIVDRVGDPLVPLMCVRQADMRTDRDIHTKHADG
jgi:hypothetical protein